MKLSDFEAYASSRILYRGLSYFEQGLVKSLRHSSNTWTAVVEGSDDYQVKVGITEDGVISGLGCDCPFDQEAICKHMVATMLAIREQQGDAGIGAGPGAGVGASSAASDVGAAGAAGDAGAAVPLKELLQGLDKAELLSILLGHASEDDALERKLRFRYSDRAAISDMPSYARRLMRESVSAASYRGFVDWDSTDQAVEGAYQAFELAKDCTVRGDCKSAVGICLAILEEMMDLEGSCDDSSGCVCDVIEQAFDDLENSVDGFAEQADADCLGVFEALFAHLHESRYDDWPERRISLLHTCIPLCSNRDVRKLIDEYLAEWLDDESSDGVFYSRYAIEHIEGLQEAIIRYADGVEAAEDFISAHLDNDAFRERRYEAAMKNADMDEALRLSIGGIEAAGRFMVIDKWRQREYQAYKMSGDIGNQRRAAKAIATSGSNDSFKYYLEFKDTFPGAEWPKAVNGFLAELQQVGHGGSIYLQVLRHECLKPQLMDYCREHPTMAFELCREILPEYRQELDTMLCELIDGMAKRVSSRGEYHDLCAKLHIYGSAIGRDQALAIRDRILAANPRKPALRDELGKL